MFRLITLLIALVLFVCNPVWADDRRDGNWWQSKTRESKVFYVAGLFDGTVLGRNFSQWGQREGAGRDAAYFSHQRYSEQYLSNVTSGQLADGLDAFYADFKNRRIQVPNAVWLVLNQIAGTPAPELERMLEGWRKNDK